MKDIIAHNFVTFIIFSAIVVLFYYPDNKVAMNSINEQNIETCKQASRGYFENLCNQSYCKVFKKSNCPVSKKSNSFIIVFELAFCWLLSMFILGRAYFPFLEKFIHIRLVQRYRSFQEDEMYFFFRFAVGAILFIVFYNFQYGVLLKYL